MDETQTAPTPQEPAASGQTHRVINWGSVLKGVAIVAAVAVAAVVGYEVITQIADPAFKALAAGPAGGVVEGISKTAASLWYDTQWLAGAAWAHVERAATWAIKAVGFEGLKWGGASAATNVAAAAGAGTIAVVGTSAVLPTLNHLPPTSNVPDVPTGHSPTLESGLLATQGAQTAHAASHSALHEVTHAAHHAAESTSEHADHKNWRGKFANRAAFASHADAARATAASRPALSQPADTFSAQLNTDRANLDAALAK